MQHGKIATKHAKGSKIRKPRANIKSCNFLQRRDDFLTVNRQINTTVTANRHSKLAKTAKPPEYNRPSIVAVTCITYLFWKKNFLKTHGRRDL